MTIWQTVCAGTPPFNQFRSFAGPDKPDTRGCALAMPLEPLDNSYICIVYSFVVIIAEDSWFD